MPTYPAMRSLTEGGSYVDPGALAALGRLRNYDVGDFSDIRNPVELQRALLGQQTRNAEMAINRLRAATRLDEAQASGAEQEALNLNPDYARQARWKDIEQADMDLYTRGLRRAQEQRRVAGQAARVPLDVAASPEAAAASEAEFVRDLEHQKRIINDPTLSADQKRAFLFQFQLDKLKSPMNFEAGSAQPIFDVGDPRLRDQPMAPAGSPQAQTQPQPAPGGGRAGGSAPRENPPVVIPRAALPGVASNFGMTPQEYLDFWKAKGRIIIVQ